MPDLQQRLLDDEVIILDGAICTELQKMGVPMDQAAWCAVGLQTDPDIVRQLHEDYIKAGADVITTNTYSSARHSLIAAGLGDSTRELNTLAVELARQARDNAAGGGQVHIAGAMSDYATFAASADEPKPSDDQLRADYDEQAEILAEAGVDLIVLELVRDLKQGGALLDAARATGLPTWLSFACSFDDRGTVSLMGGNPRPEQNSDAEGPITLSHALDNLMSKGGSAINIMHSDIDVTSAGLRIARNQTPGAVGAYAHSGHWARPDWQFVDSISPSDYLAHAKEWVDTGVQIIGGCCGIGREHIRVLKDGLPSHVPTG